MSILGVGIDIVECLRIAQMIERHGELFITRVYTDAEIEYCTARKAATQHYAGRWAAKEAVLKALGTGWRRGIGWREVRAARGEGVIGTGGVSAFPQCPVRETSSSPDVVHHDDVVHHEIVVEFRVPRSPVGLVE
jgi:phosphopantetheinyl transferase